MNDKTAETICLLAGVSQGLGADEMVVAFRDANDALRARVAKLEAALEDVLKFSNDPGVIRFVRAALWDTSQ